MTQQKCYCTQPVGSHHNPICSLFGLVHEGNIIKPETRAHTAYPFLERLRRVNRARYLEWMNSDNVDPLWAATEFGGEAGEVLNVVKKLVRESLGRPGSRASRGDLANEIADAIICLDTLARAYKIDIEIAVTNKFNQTSETNGFAHRL